MYIRMSMSMEIGRGQVDPLRLELQEVVSHSMWMLGTELGSSAEAACSIYY